MRSSRSVRPDALLAAPPAPGRVAFLLAHDVAHRGLHGPGVPENSLAAASAAIARGLAIECDVRLARDGTPLVFHDVDTGRLTGVAGRIDAGGHAGLRLADGSPVPTLPELLAVVKGRVPLLIEIKTDGPRHARICVAVRRAIEGYPGDVAIMGFDPQVPRWFAIHAPRVVRGLVVRERRGLRDAASRRLAVWRARPDFLAYDVHALPSPLPAALRRRGLPVLAWTVRTPADLALARAHADRPIVERA